MSIDVTEHDVGGDHEHRLAAGSIVAGKLRVIRRLGAGGMGAVYEVEHELTKHRRALKVLHPSIAENPTFVARFLREASAAGRIGNPHIAETFDAGKLEGGEPYLLMELLQGETLDGRLHRQGALDPGEVSELVGQACGAIAAAHDAGIVHRDLKPENLFLTIKDGASFVKVLDFGISKFEQQTGAMNVTAEGTVMGTPYYMPPEQVLGEAIDARADIYALGIILYECSCGARPYEAATLSHLAVLIHEGKPKPLWEQRPGLPRAYCDVVHRAMARVKEQRFQSVRELAAALAPFSKGKVAAPTLHEASRVVVQGAVTDVNAATAVGSMTNVPSVITATAMADSRPDHGKASKKPGGLVWAMIAGLVVVLGGGGAFLAGRSRPPAPPAAAAPAMTTSTAETRPAEPPTTLAATAATLAPTAAASIAAPPTPGTDAPRASAASARPPADTVKRVARPEASASASPGPKTRVDQKGLAGENPFR